MAADVTTSAIRDELRTHLASILYCEIETIDDDQKFADMGLDSILGLELISMVNTKYGLEEMVDTVYQIPTVNQFADYVFGRIAGGQGNGHAGG